MGEISPIPNEIAELLPWTPKKIDFDSSQGEGYSTLSDDSLRVGQIQKRDFKDKIFEELTSLTTFC